MTIHLAINHQLAVAVLGASALWGIPWATARIIAAIFRGPDR